MAAIPAPAHAQPIPALAGKPSISPQPRVEIIALTGDDVLLEQIGQALDGESTFRHVESVDAAREFVKPLRPCVLLLDARGHQDLPATVEGVQSPDGTCIVVVLAPPDASAGVARALKGSATFAILSIPVELGQTIAVLGGAREEALARLTLAAKPSVEPIIAAAASTVAIASPPPGAPPRSESAPTIIAPPSMRVLDRNGGNAARSRNGAISAAGSVGDGKRRTWIAILAGAVLVTVIAAWFSLSAPNTDDRVAATAVPAGQVDDPAVARTTTDAADVLAGSSEELLDRARSALSARRYTDPEGDNALAYFRAVLAQEPDNDEAREGLQRIGAVLDERLQSELAQRQLNDAAATLAQLKLIRPGDAALAGIDTKLAEAQIAAALDAGNLERASQLLRQASQLGTLPEPAAAHWRDEIARQGDTRAQQLAKAAAVELQQALVARTRETAVPPTAAAQPILSQSERLSQLVEARIRDGRLLEPSQDSAVAYLNALRATDPAGSAVAAGTRSLSDALLQAGRTALADRNFDAAQANATEARRLGFNPAEVDTLERAIAAARAKPEQRQLSPGELKRTRYVPPEYPKDALTRGIAGEVRVRITLDADGKVKAAAVVNSSPADVFDKAALDAVRRWRFKPLAGGNPDAEATVVTTIVFRPDDAKSP